MKKKIGVLFILLFAFIPKVLADTGPKPSITVTLKNMEGTDYLIDLVSDFKDKEDYINDIVERYSDYQERPIYQYHDGTWYATSLRDRLLWGDVNGNERHEHEFTYFGVPSEFMVIIEFSDGSIKVTDKIVKTSFDFNIEVDVNTMNVVHEIGVTNNYMKYLCILIATIIIELLIALLFKIKNYGVIIVANIITNISLQLLMVFVGLSLFEFILAELAIIGIEGIIYIGRLKVSKKKLVIYVVTANLVTALLTFLI